MTLFIIGFIEYFKIHCSVLDTGCFRHKIGTSFISCKLLFHQTNLKNPLKRGNKEKSAKKVTSDLQNPSLSVSLNDLPADSPAAASSTKSSLFTKQTRESSELSYLELKDLLLIFAKIFSHVPVKVVISQCFG